ncbi:MAG: preprotein translocase subunit SecG [Parachlamydiales bacterium]
MSILLTLSLFLFFFLCLILCAVILMQESKSMGLGASFGGDGGDSLFGTGTADVLKRFTTYLTAAFLAGCLLLSLWTSATEHTKRAKGPAVIESLAE